MKNKGFTLIELLAVLVILAIIATVIFPTVGKIIKSSEQRASNVQEATVIKAAKEYYLDHVERLPEVDSDTTDSVCIDTLHTEGYLTEQDIIDPKTREPLTGCVIVKYESNQYVYEYPQGNTEE